MLNEMTKTLNRFSSLKKFPASNFKHSDYLLLHGKINETRLERLFHESKNKLFADCSFQPKILTFNRSYSTYNYHENAYKCNLNNIGKGEQLYFLSKGKVKNDNKLEDQINFEKNREEFTFQPNSKEQLHTILVKQSTFSFSNQDSNSKQEQRKKNFSLKQKDFFMKSNNYLKVLQKINNKNQSKNQTIVHLLIKEISTERSDNLNNNQTELKTEKSNPIYLNDLSENMKNVWNFRRQIHEILPLLVILIKLDQRDSQILFIYEDDSPLNLAKFFVKENSIINRIK